MNDRKRRGGRERERENLTLPLDIGGPGTGRHTVRTSRIILDSGQFGTCPKTLRGVEEASLCG
jgi:hypothetical protein